MLMMRFVSGNRLRHEIIRVSRGQIRVTPFRFGLRTSTAQDEASASFVEHLRRASPELLAVEIAIEAYAQKTCPVFRLIRKKSPRDLARLVKERVKQIPRPRCLRLRLPVAFALHLSGNLRCIIPS